MGCTGASVTFLTVLNGLVALCALVIIGYSAYLTSLLADFKDALTTFPIIGPLVFGVFLLLVAIVGCVGVLKKNRCLLFIYIVVTFIATIVVLGSGAALLSYGGFLDNVKEGEVSDKIELQIQDFELAVFNACCVGFGVTPAVECSVNPAPPCINDANTFQEFLAKVDGEVCKALEEFEINGKPIVGDPAVNGGCGGGDAATFTSNISQFLADNIKLFGSVNLGLAIVLLLDLLASCVVLCSKKDEYYGDKKQEQKKKDNEKAGPDIAA